MTITADAITADLTQSKRDIVWERDQNTVAEVIGNFLQSNEQKTRQPLLTT